MKDKSVRSGWLTDYFAQGMEGQVEWAFMDEAFADARGWDEGGILTLNEGDMLTVFGPNGATLWAGRIERVQGQANEVFDAHGDLVPLSLIFNDSKRMPYSTWLPSGISAQDWLMWCCKRPPLRARLERVTEH